MEFTWDEKKNEQNIKKHGFDFAEANQVFDSVLISSLDESQDYGEDRWIGIGTLQNGTVVVVVFTEEEDDVIQSISMRKASKNEKEKYKKEDIRFRIPGMRDENIDYSDIPPLDENFFANAVIWKPRKKQLTIRIDSDVYDFFKSLGNKYQPRMNAVLRRYMELAQGHTKPKAS